MLLVNQCGGAMFPTTATGEIVIITMPSFWEILSRRQPVFLLQEALNTNLDCEVSEKGDSSAGLQKQSRIGKYNKEKIAILSSWFVLLVSIRVLLGFELSNVWGTTGAVAITFAIFYIALRYTPFSRYAKSVDAVLRDWYNKRYVLYGLITSMAILSTLIFLAEIGYAYHPDKIISVWDMKDGESIGSTQTKLANSLNTLLDEGYSRFDALVITIASVDKSLDGHYMQSVSFILAEDIEILVFLLLIKKFGHRNIFPTSKQDDTKKHV